jgi:hypothetical protein
MTIEQDIDGILHLRHDGSSAPWSYKMTYNTSWVPTTQTAVVSVEEATELPVPGSTTLKCTIVEILNASPNTLSFYACKTGQTTAAQALNVAPTQTVSLILQVDQSEQGVEWHVSTRSDDPVFKISYPPKRG